MAEIPRQLVGRCFQPGQSGNPGGRTKGLERRVRELLADDIDAMTLAMRDIVMGRALTEGPLKNVKITTRDRIEAYKVLTDRGWGKPRVEVKVTEGAETMPDDLSALSIAQLREIAHGDGDPSLH